MKLPLVFAAAVVLLGGCLAADGDRATHVEATTLTAGPQCGAPVAGVETLAATQVKALEGVGDAASAALASKNAIVLKISMGEQRTAGYALALADTAVPVADGVATVIVAWRAPDPGAMVAQVLTRPCLEVVLPGDDVTRVRVVDTEGRVRFAEVLE